MIALTEEEVTLLAKCADMAEVAYCFDLDETVLLAGIFEKAGYGTRRQVSRKAMRTFMNNCHSRQEREK